MSQTPPMRFRPGQQVYYKRAARYESVTIIGVDASPYRMRDVRWIVQHVAPLASGFSASLVAEDQLHEASCATGSPTACVAHADGSAMVCVASSTIASSSAGAAAGLRTATVDISSASAATASAATASAATASAGTCNPATTFSLSSSSLHSEEALMSLRHTVSLLDTMSQLARNQVESIMSTVHRLEANSVTDGAATPTPLWRARPSVAFGSPSRASLASKSTASSPVVAPTSSLPCRRSLPQFLRGVHKSGSVSESNDDDCVVVDDEDRSILSLRKGASERRSKRTKLSHAHIMPRQQTIIAAAAATTTSPTDTPASAHAHATATGSTLVQYQCDVIVAEGATMESKLSMTSAAHDQSSSLAPALPRSLSPPPELASFAGEVTDETTLLDVQPDVHPPVVSTPSLPAASLPSAASLDPPAAPRLSSSASIAQPAVQSESQQQLSPAFESMMRDASQYPAHATQPTTEQPSLVLELSQHDDDVNQSEHALASVALAQTSQSSHSSQLSDHGLPPYVLSQVQEDGYDD